MTKSQRAKQDHFNNVMSRFMLAYKTGDRATMHEMAAILESRLKAWTELKAMRWTTKGDFSHLHANPLICK